MDFTQNQKNAIELRGRNILVSAAAGSGKTATLTERIIRLLTDKTDPADIGRMLIVTFTRAAAGELRTRISKKLSDALAIDPSNHHLAKQLTSLGGAKICTIDSYYLDLVRSNFQKLDIPAKFRLADETELKILRFETMNSVIERRYDTDESFAKYADTITTAKGENKLAEILLDLERKIASMPRGIEYLKECSERYTKDIGKDLFDTIIGMKMRSDIIEEIGFLLKRTDRLIELIDQNPQAAPYGRAVSSDRDFISSLAALLESSSYADIREFLFTYSPAKLGNIKSDNKDETTEEIKEERTEVKERIIELREREFSALPHDMEQICKSNSELCAKTYEVLYDYSHAYADEKRERSVCEFSDLRKYALELLIDKSGNPTKLALDERENYDNIFVDEYQDTDAVQDLVFQTISNGRNLFFVGDIKQSIYSFRGAEPSVFASYRRTYSPIEFKPEAPSPTSIFMSDNFRCSPNVITFTNTVCSYLFRETEANGHGIGYVAEDDLIAARNEPISNEKVKVVLIEESKETASELHSECSYVIEEIKKVLKTSKPDGNPYSPRDIAILTRSNKEASVFANALAEAGIPHANSTGNDLFENSEVLLMLCLLSAADNPQQDIPLAGALKSPIFGFTLSDLVNIRIGRLQMSLYNALCDYSSDEESDPALRTKCSNAVSKITDYRTEAESVPVHQFMRYLWRETNALCYAGADKSSANRTHIERRRNLRKFYEYARRYEASSFKGLHDFVEYINGVISQGTKITDEDAVTENTIQIMTIHKSKGLEFPTVFLVGCDRAPNDQDSRKSVVFSSGNDLGMAFKISDSSGLGLLDTPQRITIAKQISELSSEEEIRILYVALTRARDNLYVVASGSEGFAEKRLTSAMRRASIGGRHSVLESGRYIDRILTALSSEINNGAYIIEFPSFNNPSKDLYIDNVIDALPEADSDIIYDELKKSFGFKYPYSEISSIPSKVSVSKLYPELLNDAEEYEDIIIKAEKLETKVPRFMGGQEDAADRGTATHLFMQFCDFSKLKATRESVTEEISRLVSLRFISNEIAHLIRIDEIVKFVRSDFFDIIRSASDINREFRFNVFLPASEFTTSHEKKKIYEQEKVLVQGVIDLCFRDSESNLILCDYKTDRLPHYAISDKIEAVSYLSDRHREQLTYYAAAIEQIMGQKPDKIYIYSLAFGDALEIIL